MKSSKFIRTTLLSLVFVLFYVVSVFAGTGVIQFGDPTVTRDKTFNLAIKVKSTDVRLKSADITIARSGSLSLSEMKASGVASILVPYPFAAGDHQKKNAQAMVEEGCSIMIEDNELSAEKIYTSIKELLTSSEVLNSMKENSINRSMPNATKKIVKNLLEI